MNFNWEIYRELNPDLVKEGLTTKLHFVRHYNIHGITEKRKHNIYQAYPDFDPEQYSSNYKDLESLNNTELELHWIKYGRKEGRNYKGHKKIKPKSSGNNKYSLINGIDIIYWINLDRSKDRRSIMEGMFKNIKVPNIRISASDGKLLPNIKNNFIFNHAHSEQSPGIYGCLLSHLRTINEFWNSDKKLALILEDDISLDFMQYWDKSLHAIINEAPVNWEIIMMSYTNTDINSHKMLFNKWNPTIYSTMAYIINRKGAQKIMNMYKNDKWNITSIHPVSDMVIYEKCNTYVYRYPYFTINNNMASLIHNDHLLQHNKSKEFSKMIWISSKIGGNIKC